MENDILFSLIPVSATASRIVRAADRRYRDVQKGAECLSFKAGHRSRFPGRLLSIGCLAGINDVILPEDGAAQLQCSFYLVPSGELMLEDATTGHHTYIDWYDHRLGKQEKYSLQGDPRRRIIPRASAKMISICFGQEVSFQFEWQKSTEPAVAETWGKQLAMIARATIDPTKGMSLAVPRDPTLPPTAYEPRTINTPKIHVYKTIGSGAFGKVFEAVDLATGRIWAVKECKYPDDKAVKESWKASFRSEVEKLAMLSHPNIIPLEHHQGWSLGRPVQIFLKLCEGSLSDLLPRSHRCLEESSVEKTWLPRFIDQVLSGLAYMHKHDLIHRDIKPQNILFNQERGHSRPTFYISDLGIATSKNHIRDLIGTRHYMAPESTRYGDFALVSDIYSFGIMLLEVLGKYCTQEARLSVDEWREKLRAHKVREFADYDDEKFPKAKMKEVQAAHSRIQSLVDYNLLRSSVRHLLNQDPKRRSTAVQARHELLESYPIEGKHRHPPPADPAPRRRPTGFGFDIPFRRR